MQQAAGRGASSLFFYSFLSLFLRLNQNGRLRKKKNPRRAKTKDESSFLLSFFPSFGLLPLANFGIRSFVHLLLLLLLPEHVFLFVSWMWQMARCAVSPFFFILPTRTYVFVRRRRRRRNARPCIGLMVVSVPPPSPKPKTPKAHFG